MGNVEQEEKGSVELVENTMKELRSNSITLVRELKEKYATISNPMGVIEYVNELCNIVFDSEVNNAILSKRIDKLEVEMRELKIEKELNNNECSFKSNNKELRSGY